MPFANGRSSNSPFFITPDLIGDYPPRQRNCIIVILNLFSCAGLWLRIHFANQTKALGGKMDPGLGRGDENLRLFAKYIFVERTVR